MNDDQACETPLIKLLQRVPRDARAQYEHDKTSHSFIPYGRLCQEAAAEIARLHAKLVAVEDAIDMATQGKYSALMLELADGRAKQIADGLEVCRLKGDLAAANELLLAHNADADMFKRELLAANERLAEAEKIAEKLRKRANNQRIELRRLNKYLGPYWFGFRRGLDRESECKLRAIMNKTFGHEKVHAAEHAAIDIDAAKAKKK